MRNLDVCGWPRFVAKGPENHSLQNVANHCVKDRPKFLDAIYKNMDGWPNISVIQIPIRLIKRRGIGLLVIQILRNKRERETFGSSIKYVSNKQAGIVF